MSRRRKRIREEAARAGRTARQQAQAEGDKPERATRRGKESGGMEEKRRKDFQMSGKRGIFAAKERR